MNYHDRPEISSSDLEYIDKSLLHYQHYKANPPRPTHVQVLGRLAHSYILEDKVEWADESVIKEQLIEDRGKFSRRYKEYKTWKAAQDRPILKSSEVQNIKHMKEAIDYSFDGLIEHEVYFKYLDVDCRSKLDCVTEQEIIDLKTVTDAGNGALTYKIKRYNYYRQAAFYKLAMKQSTGQELSFKFIFVEREAPYGVREVQLTEEYLNYGASEIDRILNRYKLMLAKEEQADYNSLLIGLEGPIEVADVDDNIPW